MEVSVSGCGCVRIWVCPGNGCGVRVGYFNALTKLKSILADTGCTNKETQIKLFSPYRAPGNESLLQPRTVLACCFVVKKWPEIVRLHSTHDGLG